MNAITKVARNQPTNFNGCRHISRVLHPILSCSLCLLRRISFSTLHWLYLFIKAKMQRLACTNCFSYPLNALANLACPPGVRSSCLVKQELSGIIFTRLVDTFLMNTIISIQRNRKILIYEYEYAENGEVLAAISFHPSISCSLHI